MHSGDLLHFFTTQLTDQSLADCRRLRGHTPPIPDIHFDETWRFDSFDVNSVAMIENRKVRSQTRRLNELSQVRHGELPQGHALHRLPAETQNADPQRMLTSLWITSHVPTPDQRAQQITCRALRQPRQTANLGRAEPVISARQKLENR